ncbi:hypothetical protein [Mesorhizobium sp. LNJC403B00]|uniref:hypothetical protein n=1 Tax=Mesorhizobium sp. LNJC403B00 TaxID=1287280 RepID=UPI001FDA0835|nr:hypothetical protein [Mesorhizobium sp. LNJC403B00]
MLKGVGGDNHIETLIEQFAKKVDPQKMRLAKCRARRGNRGFGEIDPCDRAWEHLSQEVRTVAQSAPQSQIVQRSSRSERVSHSGR